MHTKALRGKCQYGHNTWLSNTLKGGWDLTFSKECHDKVVLIYWWGKNPKCRLGMKYLSNKLETLVIVVVKSEGRDDDCECAENCREVNGP